MRFINRTETALCFELADGAYEVPAGAVVEVEDKWAYCVQSRGLPLDAFPDDEKPPGAIVRPKRVRPAEVKLPAGIELTKLEQDEDEDDAESEVAMDEEIVPEAVREALAPKPGKKKGR